MRLFLAATVAFANVVGMLAPPALAQTAIRPDQISPGTPDITWGPGGAGYVIGSTVPWRSDSTATPPVSSNDAAKIVELTNSGAISLTLPAISGALGDGFGFGIQVRAGTLTITGTSATVNGLPSIKAGPYQFVSLSSKNGNWYAALSVPQPTTQTGSKVLADNMTWVTAGTAGPTTCTESNNFITRATVSAAPDTSHTNAYHTLICGLVTDGVWAVLDTLYMLATDTATHANLNLVSSSYTLVPAGSPAFVVDSGYTGVSASTSVYLDTTFNPSTAGGHYTQNSASLAAYLLTNNTTSPIGATSGQPIGAQTGAANVSSMIPHYTDAGSNDNSYCYMNMDAGVGNINALSIGTSIGMWLCTRRSTSDSALYRNAGSIATSSQASTAAPNLSFYLLATHDITTGNWGSNRQQAMAALGGGMTPALITAFNSRVCAYLNAIHGAGTC